MLEHINGRRYWNFMELYNGSDGTEQLWFVASWLSSSNLFTVAISSVRSLVITTPKMRVFVRCDF